MAPVSKNGAREFLTAPRAPPIVHRQHRVTIRGEDLPFNAKRMLILTVRSAMDAEEKRHLRSLHISNGISQQTVDFGSIFALEADRLRLPHLQLCEQSIVLMRKLFELQFVTYQLGGI